MNFFTISDHIAKETHYINLDLVKRISYIDKNSISELISISIHYTDDTIDYYNITQAYFDNLMWKINERKSYN